MDSESLCGLMARYTGLTIRTDRRVEKFVGSIERWVGCGALDVSGVIRKGQEYGWDRSNSSPNEQERQQHREGGPAQATRLLCSVWDHVRASHTTSCFVCFGTKAQALRSE